MWDGRRHRADRIRVRNHLAGRRERGNAIDPFRSAPLFAQSHSWTIGNEVWESAVTGHPILAIELPAWLVAWATWTGDDVDPSVWDEAVRLLTSYLNRLSTGNAQRSEHSGGKTILDLLTGDIRTAEATQKLSHNPADLSRRTYLVDILRQVCQDDPALQAALSKAVLQSHNQELANSTITRTVTIGGDNAGDVVQGDGHLIKGNRNHIGDRIINKFKTDRKSQVIGGLVLVAVIALLVWAATGMGADRATASSDSVATTASPPPNSGGGAATPLTSQPPPPLGAGQTVFSGTADDAHADGTVLVTELQEHQDPTFTATDLATGQRLTSFTVAAYPNSLFRCDFTVVHRSDGTDVLLLFKKETTAAQGTVPEAETDSLTGYDTRTGALLWTAAGPQVSNPDTTASQSGSGCAQGAANISSTADGDYVLFHFRSGDPHVISLVSGKSITVPSNEHGLVGNWVAVPVYPAQTSAGAPPDHVNLLNPSDGSVAGALADQRAGQNVGDQRHEAVSTDGKVLVYNDRDRGLMAFSLPSGSELWTGGAPDSSFIHADSTTSAIVSGDNTLVGNSLQSGAPTWQLPRIDFVCGYSAGRVYVIANHQFATLDDATGKQLSYDPQTTSCPTLLEGGVLVTTRSGTNAMTVTKL